jgi:hypothetical protein
MRSLWAGSTLAVVDSMMQAAWAHDGHGAPSDHMHVTDWVGWAAVTVLVALWLLGRRRR